MSAAIETGRDDIVVGEVKALFPVRWPVATRSPYDVSADGQRILMNVLDDAAGANPITIVVNWTAGIKN